MPFHIKELFLNIIKYYNNINYIYDILTIIQFNRISKIHYKWFNMFNEIKYSILWLNVQNIRKTINHNYSIDKGYIEHWADWVSEGKLSYISKQDVLNA